MSEADFDEFSIDPTLRKAVYALIVISALAACLGRIAGVRSKDGRSPFHSANDRSRWCTIRNLVEKNSFAIDRFEGNRIWHTIDKVRHRGTDGKEHYYSSKPPLYPTLIAGQYWLIHRLTGADFDDHMFAVARTILILTNFLPLVLYFWLLVGLIERWCVTDWGRLFAVAAASWGTYLTTFAITLNNHLPAAICTLIALHVFIAIWYDEKTQPRYFIMAGLAAAFAAANELPALSLLGLLGLALLYKNWRATLAYGTPAVALVVVAFFAVNYVAHGSLRPPYMHRSVENPDDNWYAYPGSYWTGERTGVDAGEPSKLKYGMHCLIGHHGIFSLTPIWCLSALGVFLLPRGNREVPMPALATGIVILTSVCLLFYVVLRPEIDRNYGGVSSGFRWMFWFTPLWIFAMLPTLDQIAHSMWQRRVAYALLAVSVFSVSYPYANPWQHPWLYSLLRSMGVDV